MAQVVCPECGHRFALDEQVVDPYRRNWLRSERQRIKNELNAENHEQMKAEAKRMAAKEVREIGEVVRERDRQISGLKRTVTALNKKLPAGRAQALGDVREETLAQSLIARCPQDEVLAVSKRGGGADLVQSVRDLSGCICGTIAWESKRAASWSKGWVPKLRDDMRRGNHTVGVIVSDVLPDPDRIIVNIDGIWVTTLDAAPDLAVLLRDAVVQVAMARGARGRRDDLKGVVYDYMVGPFGERMTVIVENLHKMRSGIDLERRALNARLSERETELDTVVVEFAGIYGDLRGLGSALPPIQTLELPAPETNGELPPAG
jgi:hypothetical protein